ncbi:hypothetical protein [Corynebacterium suedekumii]|uniref:Uncharacterized protein n=1 Tax=Corynebacterium suedekumii TaxID=3049801 RepID=A0ABY8VQH0_9CORY|nr:hypothetical protein [Corynebacterium suedekumii]WIM70443.1 hypothetical protein QP029_00785 [Corynebacterium suedekumii]
MHNHISHALSSHLHAASPIQDRLGRERHIHSVAVKINQEDPQTAWVTITDRTDTGELSDHLFSYSWPGRLFVDSLTDAILESYLHVITGDEYVGVSPLSGHAGLIKQRVPR